MLAPDADIPLPDHSSSKTPDQHYKRHRPLLDRKMAPRGDTGRGQAQRVFAMRRGFPPPRNSPTSICEMGSCPPADFERFESSPRLSGPTQRPPRSPATASDLAAAQRRLRGIVDLASTQRGIDRTTYCFIE